MSTLTLDRSDPEVDKLVSAWKNGGIYQVMLRIEQIGSDPKAATFHVAEVQNETEGETAETPAQPEAHSFLLLVCGAESVPRKYWEQPLVAHSRSDQRSSGVFAIGLQKWCGLSVSPMTSSSVHSR